MVVVAAVVGGQVRSKNAASAGGRFCKELGVLQQLGPWRVCVCVCVCGVGAGGGGCMCNVCYHACILHRKSH